MLLHSAQMENLPGLNNLGSTWASLVRENPGARFWGNDASVEDFLGGSRTGQLPGVMVNNTYCLAIHDFAATASLPFNEDLRNRHRAEFWRTFLAMFFNCRSGCSECFRHFQ
jgi:hypothetical protein